MERVSVLYLLGWVTGFVVGMGGFMALGLMGVEWLYLWLFAGVRECRKGGFRIQLSEPSIIAAVLGRATASIVLSQRNSISLLVHCLLFPFRQPQLLLVNLALALFKYFLPKS